MAIQYDPFLTKILRRISTALIDAAAQAAAQEAAQEAAAQAAEEFGPQVESIVTAAVEGALDTMEEAIDAVNVEIHELWRHLQFRTARGIFTFDTLDCGDAFPEEPYPLDWDFGEWAASGPALQFKNWTVQP